jgi:orotidine-5'-phosphate decarboxylase
VGKYVILLALTSNKGASDFQYMKENDERLFEKVINTSKQWGDEENMMYVVGATRAEMLQDIRKAAPKHFLLVPGVGAQGGSLAEVARNGMNEQCGLLVNSSRGIIFAGEEEDFAISFLKQSFTKGKILGFKNFKTLVFGAFLSKTLNFLVFLLTLFNLINSG